MRTKIGFGIIGFGCLLTLASCGGGSGGSTVQQPVVVNTPPTASGKASAESVKEGRTFDLDASDSSDAQGDALTFSWSQKSGPTLDLSGMNVNAALLEGLSIPNLTADTDFVFTVDVSDNQETTSADVTVTGLNIVLEPLLDKLEAADVDNIETEKDSFGIGVTGLSLSSSARSLHLFSKSENELILHEYDFDGTNKAVFETRSETILNAPPVRGDGTRITTSDPNWYFPVTGSHRISLLEDYDRVQVLPRAGEELVSINLQNACAIQPVQQCTAADEYDEACNNVNLMVSHTDGKVTELTGRSRRESSTKYVPESFDPREYNSATNRELCSLSFADLYSNPAQTNETERTYNVISSPDIVALDHVTGEVVMRARHQYCSGSPGSSNNFTEYTSNLNLPFDEGLEVVHATIGFREVRIVMSDGNVEGDHRLLYFSQESSEDSISLTCGGPETERQVPRYTYELNHEFRWTSGKPVSFQVPYIGLEGVPYVLYDQYVWRTDELEAGFIEVGVGSTEIARDFSYGNILVNYPNEGRVKFFNRKE